ncbi:MAG: zinc-ribbon domain-containing protein [Pseudomonadota bacterium]
MSSMIIACPHCQTRFQVAEDRFLPSGRSVRCSECATSWFVPAPQAIETLSPQTRLKDRADAPGAAHPPESRTDRVDQFVHNQHNPHLNPAGPRTAQPARGDRVVDTDWQEVGGAKRWTGEERRGVEQASLRPTIKRVEEDAGERSTIDRIQKARQQGLKDAPGEVFTAIKVQPRELERALKKVRRKAEAREKNRLTPLRVLGWMALGCVTAGFLFGGYHYRDDIMRQFPGTAKAYARLGIDAKPFGLSLENISHKVALSTSGPVLMIQGELHNDGTKLIVTPLLQAEALDGRGRLLASWTFAPEQSSVPSRSFAAFATRNPAPEGVTEVILSFAPKKSRTEPFSGRDSAPK